MVTGSSGQQTNAIFAPTLTDIEILETIVSDSAGDGYPSMHYYKIKISGNNPNVTAKSISTSKRVKGYIFAYF